MRVTVNADFKPDLNTEIYIVVAGNDDIYTIVKGVVESVREVEYLTFQMHSEHRPENQCLSCQVDTKEVLNPYTRLTYGFLTLPEATKKLKLLLNEQIEAVKANRKSLLTRSKRLAQTKKQLKTLISSLDTKA